MDEFREILRQIIQQAQDLADEFSEEEMIQITNFVTKSIAFLERQTQEQPQEGLTPTEAPIEPPLKQSMPSSNVYAFGYDDENGKLLVKFQGNAGSGEGPVYAYEGIPKVIFDLFQKGAIPARTTGRNKWGSWWKGKVPSLGASLYSLISSQNYPYKKVS